MTLTLIGFIIAFLLPTIGGIVILIKQKKANRKELEKKDGTIKQLRKGITEMIELDGDKKDVDINRKKIKKNIDSMSDDDLSIAYANELPNMPIKRKRTNKKS